MLNECAVGISLMLSPHPSYPPLEMAHSGLLTITNSYGDKDLSSWHENIRSMTRITPEELAKAVERCVNLFEEDHTVGIRGRSKVPFYFRDDDEYEKCLFDLARAIRNESWSPEAKVPPNGLTPEKWT
jgi:O-antigen biosynthesis protein